MILSPSPGSRGSKVFDPTSVFSVLATVEKRFGLESLTNRDKAANTLEAARSFFRAVVVQSPLRALEHPQAGDDNARQPIGGSQLEMEIYGEAKLERVKGIEPSSPFTFFKVFYYNMMRL